jgi:PTS system fructose-specific IIA component
MNIQSLLHDQSIMIPLETSDKESCIRAMIDGLEAAGCISDKTAYLDAVTKREQTGSTGIGFGVAIPHGKSNGVSKAGLAFAKPTQPLNWQSLDGNPVSIVFMIAVPEEAAGNEHLQILIGLSRKLIDEQFRQSLLEVTESQQLMAILQTI